MADIEVKASINSPAMRLMAIKRAIKRSRAIFQKSVQNQPIQNGAAKRPVIKRSSPMMIAKKRKQAPLERLSSLYNVRNSLLRNLASLRLTAKFVDNGIPLTDLRYTHTICPEDFICFPDLIGTCTDKNCIYQHKSNYLMSDIDKLVDILSYKPSLTGFKLNPSLSRGENLNRCRIELKQYAAKLIAKNPYKPVETIAQNLVKYVRVNKSDAELLIMTRKLPKPCHVVVKSSPDDNRAAVEQEVIFV